LPLVVQDGTYSYVYGLDLIAAIDGSSNELYYLYDGLGSVAELTDDSGVVTDSYVYDVFGAVTSSTGSTANDWLFTGEQEDGETGLYFLRARYYDPETGRFLARDPLEFNQRYAYAGNNPATMVDPSGLVPGPDPDAYYRATRRGTCAVLGWFRTSCDETNESTLGAVDAAADRVDVGVGRVAGGIDDSLESASDAGREARAVLRAAGERALYWIAVDAQQREAEALGAAPALWDLLRDTPPVCYARIIDWANTTVIRLRAGAAAEVAADFGMRAAGVATACSTRNG
jgi:RHS repeat-associated protein